MRIGAIFQMRSSSINADQASDCVAKPVSWNIRATPLTMSAHALEAATAVNGYLLHPKFPEFGYNLFERDAI